MIALFLLVGGVDAFADGKMYAEKVNTTIPYQRALILFDKGKETLILQSQYQIPGNAGRHTLGWVVPVPAVPEIASMRASDADWLFSACSEMSASRTTYWRDYVLLSIFGLSICIGVIAPLFSFVPRLIRYKRVLRSLAMASVVVVLIVMLVAPMVIRQSKGIGGVEVIKSGKIGIYDTKVIRSESPAALVQWFNENSFHFDLSDEKAIRSYLDRKWFFVTAKVDANLDSSNGFAVSKKLLAPLILNFPTENPVYPTALTATGGHPTEILIYLVSGGPMKTQSPLIPRFRGAMRGSSIYYPVSIEPEEFWDHCVPWDVGYLNKFKATLTPAQMERDIEFHPDPGAQPYREHLYRW